MSFTRRLCMCVYRYIQPWIVIECSSSMFHKNAMTSTNGSHRPLAYCNWKMVTFLPRYHVVYSYLNARIRQPATTCVVPVSHNYYLALMIAKTLLKNDPMFCVSFLKFCLVPFWQAWRWKMPSSYPLDSPLIFPQNY